MTRFPETSEAFLAAVDEARKIFFAEYGDSANSVIVSRELFQRIPDHARLAVVAEDGELRVRGLALLFADIPGHPFCVAIVHDPFHACERCGSL